MGESEDAGRAEAMSIIPDDVHVACRAEVERLRAELNKERACHDCREFRAMKEAEVERLLGEVLKWTALSKTHSQAREQAEARLREVVGVCEREAPSKDRIVRGVAFDLLVPEHRLATLILAAAQPKEESRD